MRSELIVALWESVTKMKYAKSEGQCVAFLSNAIRNKFYELYRNSKKLHDNQVITDDEILNSVEFEESEYNDLIIKTDLDIYLSKYKGLRYQIYRTIVFERLSDIEISEKYNVTRQYVNRLKRQLYLELQEKYFGK